VVIGTVSQIEVDQGLIGDAFCVGQRLEVVDGDLFFQPVRVGVFSWVQLTDVIFISHTITSNSIKLDALLGFGCLPCRSNLSVSIIILYILNNYFQENQTAVRNLRDWLERRFVVATEQGRRPQTPGVYPARCCCAGELWASWMPNNGLPVCAMA